MKRLFGLIVIFIGHPKIFRKLIINKITKMKTFKNIALTLLSSTLFFACSSDDDNNTTQAKTNANVTFDARVGSADFALDTPYTINGTSYQFDGLRYWVGNVEFVNKLFHYPRNLLLQHMLYYHYYQNMMRW
jgi:hypothetical protein